MSDLQSLRGNFTKELIERNLDLAFDYSEIAIDTFIEDGILKDIPIINSLVSLGKLGVTVRNIHFSKKILYFLKQFHLNEPLTMEMKKLLFKIKNDEKFRQKVVDHLLIMIDRYLSEEKAVHLANLFSGYINEKFDWGTFVYFSTCLDSIHDLDFELLLYLLSNPDAVVDQISLTYFDKYLLLASVERLKNFGFIGSDEPTWDSIGDDFKQKIFISSLGNLFANGCLKTF